MFVFYRVETYLHVSIQRVSLKTLNIPSFCPNCNSYLLHSLYVPALCQVPCSYIYVCVYIHTYRCLTMSLLFIQSLFYGRQNLASKKLSNTSKWQSPNSHQGCLFHQTTVGAFLSTQIQCPIQQKSSFLFSNFLTP